MHLPEVCVLDWVIGVKGIMDPVVTMVVGTACYLRFISYGLALITPGACGLCWWRLSSRVLSCITGDVLLLGASSIGGVVDGIARSMTGDIGSWIGRCVGNNVNWLHDFILTTSLFSHGQKGSVIVVVTMMAGSLQPTPGVGTCGRSAVSWTSFFDLGGGNVNVSL
jgi:hypothetical protein